MSKVNKYLLVISLLFFFPAGYAHNEPLEVKYIIVKFLSPDEIVSAIQYNAMLANTVPIDTTNKLSKITVNLPTGEKVSILPDDVRSKISIPNPYVAKKTEEQNLLVIDMTFEFNDGELKFSALTGLSKFRKTSSDTLTIGVGHIRMPSHSVIHMVDISN